MKKLTVNIDEKFKDTEIIINSNKINDTIVLIENIVDNNFEYLVAYKNNKIYCLELDEIVKIKSEDGSNFCYTKKDRFLIKETLTYLENKLKVYKFLRISNACIINVKKVNYFDTTFTGHLKIVFDDGTHEDASIRKVKYIMDYLKGKKEL